MIVVAKSGKLTYILPNSITRDSQIEVQSAIWVLLIIIQGEYFQPLTFNYLPSAAFRLPPSVFD